MKYYTVEFYSKISDQWCPVIGATAVSKGYAQGYCDGAGSFYPCPARRIVEYNTDNIIEEFPENGKVTVNTNGKNRTMEN